MATKQAGDVRREQIAQAALAIISTRGLRGVSVAAVARRVGLVPSAIYRHYRDKDAVLDAALDHIGDRLLANVAAVVDERGDAVAHLRALLRRHIDLIKSNQAIPRAVFAEEMYAGRSERRTRMFTMIRRYLDRVAEVVREGQKERSIRRDLDPSTVALLFLGLVQPAAILWHMSAGELDVSRHAERAWLVFSEAIRPR